MYLIIIKLLLSEYYINIITIKDFREVLHRKIYYFHNSNFLIGEPEIEIQSAET